MEEQGKRKGEVTVPLGMVLKDLRIIFLRSTDPKHQTITIIPGKGFLHEEEKIVLMDAIRQIVTSTDQIDWVDTQNPSSLMISMKNFSQEDLADLKRKIRR